MITVLSSFGFAFGVGLDAGVVAGFDGVALVETCGVGRVWLGPGPDVGVDVLLSPVFDDPISELELSVLELLFD